MPRADPRPKELVADAHAAAGGRLADPACRDRHGPKRKAEGRRGVRGRSPGTLFLTQEKKNSVFFFFYRDPISPWRQP